MSFRVDTGTLRECKMGAIDQGVGIQKKKLFRRRFHARNLSIGAEVYMLPSTKNNREQEDIRMDRRNFIDGKKEGGGLAPHPRGSWGDFSYFVLLQHRSVPGGSHHPFRWYNRNSTCCHSAYPDL